MAVYGIALVYQHGKRSEPHSTAVHDDFLRQFFEVPRHQPVAAPAAFVDLCQAPVRLFAQLEADLLKIAALDQRRAIAVDHAQVHPQVVGNAVQLECLRRNLCAAIRESTRATVGSRRPLPK